MPKAAHIADGAAPLGARLAVAAIFVVNGALLGTWASRIPAVQEGLGLSPAELGLALTGVPVGLMPAVLAAGWLNTRRGSRSVTAWSAPLCCAALPPLALAPGLWWLALGLVAFGVASGTLDVAMNTEAAALERRHGRPLMSGFHGLFSVGGLAGGACGGLAAGRGITPLPHCVGAALLLGALALAATPRLLPTPAMPPSGPAFARPTQSLVGLGVVACCGLLIEGAMGDWSAVYLRDALAAAPGPAAAGFAAFSLAMAASRLAGDALTHRLGPARLVRLGALLASLASTTAGARPHVSPTVGPR